MQTSPCDRQDARWEPNNPRSPAHRPPDDMDHTSWFVRNGDALPDPILVIAAQGDPKDRANSGFRDYLAWSTAERHTVWQGHG
jgi:hypothetical protein